MESTLSARTRRPAWRPLLLGFLLGIMASFLILVALALKWGPRGQSISVDLYSGKPVTYKWFLWKRWETRGPIDEHVKWAIENQDPKRSWYIVAATGSRHQWFTPMVWADTTTRSYVYDIHSLPIPEAEKIELLHEYHNDLDALKLEEQRRSEYWNFMEPFYTKWDHKLKEISDSTHPRETP